MEGRSEGEMPANLLSVGPTPVSAVRGLTAVFRYR